MDRVEALLYLLMRDVLPTGKLRAVIGELATAEVENFEPSSPELGALARRYAAILRDGKVAEEESDEEPRVAALKVQQRPAEAGKPPALLFTTPEGEELSSEMWAWLTKFDERVLRLPGFELAVHEAAEAGRLLDEETARLVYERAQEISTEQSGEEAVQRG